MKQAPNDKKKQRPPVKKVEAKEDAQRKTLPKETVEEKIGDAKKLGDLIKGLKSSNETKSTDITKVVNDTIKEVVRSQKTTSKMWQNETSKALVQVRALVHGLSDDVIKATRKNQLVEKIDSHAVGIDDQKRYLSMLATSERKSKLKEFTLKLREMEAETEDRIKLKKLATAKEEENILKAAKEKAKKIREEAEEESKARNKELSEHIQRSRLAMSEQRQQQNEALRDAHHEHLKKLKEDKEAFDKDLSDRKDKSKKQRKENTVEHKLMLERMEDAHKHKLQEERQAHKDRMRLQRENIKKQISDVKDIRRAKINQLNKRKTKSQEMGENILKDSSIFIKMGFSIRDMLKDRKKAKEEEKILQEQEEHLKKLSEKLDKDIDGNKEKEKVQEEEKDKPKPEAKTKEADKDKPKEQEEQKEKKEEKKIPKPDLGLKRLSDGFSSFVGLFKKKSDGDSRSSGIKGENDEADKLINKEKDAENAGKGGSTNFNNGSVEDPKVKEKEGGGIISTIASIASMGEKLQLLGKAVEYVVPLIRALGPAAAVAASAYAGWQVGTKINDGINDIVKDQTKGQYQSLGEFGYDFIDALKGNKTTAQLNQKVTLDEVNEVRAKQGKKPMTQAQLDAVQSGKKVPQASDINSQKQKADDAAASKVKPKEAGAPVIVDNSVKSNTKVTNVNSGKMNTRARDAGAERVNVGNKPPAR